MKHLMTLAGLSLAALIAGPATAVDLTPIPLGPEIVLSPQEGQIVDGPVYVDEAPIALFDCVKYVDRHEMHPCAVPKIIMVNDPCACKVKTKCKHKCDGCNLCTPCCEPPPPPPCVYIQICVPPCGCELVKCRRDGDRIRYDYGKYAVDVRVKKGFIVVDYQD